MSAEKGSFLKHPLRSLKEKGGLTLRTIREEHNSYHRWADEHEGFSIGAIEGRTSQLDKATHRRATRVINRIYERSRI